ncbi:MAG: biotin--[acetyl-CoA-carboxylase] ligase [Bacteroidales bacterium]|nr:biotin--[acetyl-CoA-carboxylase] ligase [Bacteroidales bacterium]
MNIELIREYCLSKAGTTEDCAFGPDTVLFRIKDKIFACIDTERPNLIVVKCDPEEINVLCERYNGIKRAWHWNKRHWIEIYFDSDVSDTLVRELVERAYMLVVQHLPKKTLYHFPETPAGWDYIHFAQLDSVMNYLSSREADELPRDILLTTVDYQTKGRGQRGNKWEAENGANLLIGMRLRHLDFPADRQFCFTETIAVTCAQAIGKYLGGNVSIKWPNDLYVGDKKIGGMLFEHTLAGDRLVRTHIGIGINVNQVEFPADLPNPTSVRLEYGKEVDRAALLRGFVKVFNQWYTRLCKGLLGRTDLEYRNRLYRREGIYPFRDAEGTFEASIQGIGENGHLQLKDTTGRIREYAFKEVEYIL